MGQKIYTVHAQYLLPVWKPVRVLADSEEAALTAVQAEEQRTWDFWENAKEDYECGHNVSFEVSEEEEIEDVQPEDYDLKAE